MSFFIFSNFFNFSSLDNLSLPSYFFFFFNDTATTEIYTLSLHDALPICGGGSPHQRLVPFYSDYRHAGLKPLSPVVSTDAGYTTLAVNGRCLHLLAFQGPRSEEHTSELQSHSDLVCRLLLEKKKKKNKYNPFTPMCNKALSRNTRRSLCTRPVRSQTWRCSSTPSAMLR